MQITQQCSSCQSLYHVSAGQYKTLKIAYCPACGHPNGKSPVIKKKATRQAAQVITAGGKTKQQVILKNSGTLSRGGVKAKTFEKAQPLEVLRRKIEEVGKVFLISGRHDFDLDMLTVSSIPCVCLNNSWEQNLETDALVLTDGEYLQGNFKKIDEWQAKYKGKFIFIQRKMKEKTWVKKGGFYGSFVDKSGKVYLVERVLLKYSTVYFFDTCEKFTLDFELPFVLQKDNSAMNLLRLLKAENIYIIGNVDLEDTREDTGDLEDTRKEEDTRKDTGEEEVKENKKRHSIKIETHLDFEKATSNDYPYFVAKLMEKIQHAGGKLFVLGCAPSLTKLPLSQLFGFPTLGCNSAFQKYPHLDALAFGDRYFIEKWQTELKTWQELRDEKPILVWQGYGGGSKLQKILAYTKGQPSTVIYENLPGRIMPIFALKHSIITVAINAAYWLGAKEIYLLGTEVGAGHFFDPDGQIYKDLGKIHDRFPHVEKIIPFVKRQHQYLASKGVSLSTCWPGECALTKVIPYVPLEEAADNRFLSQLGR